MEEGDVELGVVAAEVVAEPGPTRPVVEEETDDATPQESTGVGTSPEETIIEEEEHCQSSDTEPELHGGNFYM